MPKRKRSSVSKPLNDLYNFELQTLKIGVAASIGNQFIGKLKI